VAVRELLLNFSSQGKTIFLSSHLLSEVELVCDRVAILSRGMVVRTGTLSSMLETTDQVEIVAKAISSMQFTHATVEGERTRFAIAKTQQREAIEGIWGAGGEVVSVNPVRRSLEDLFLELTGPESSRVEVAGQEN